MSDNLRPEDFYDQLSGSYDTMTNDSSRWKEIIDDYNNLFEQLEVRSVLDAGCGTGGEAIELAKIGCEVAGVDASSKFIENARKKVASDDLKIDFHQADLGDLSILDDRVFDAIICRGNTLPHLRTIDDLKQVFGEFGKHAKPGAMLVLEWLNYIQIMKVRQRLVGVSGDESNVFMRFYDFIDEEEVNFNIIHHKRDEKWTSNWQTTSLKPWLPDDVGMILRQCGWHKLRIYDNIKRGEFDPQSSKNVLLTARREYETLV